MPFIGTMIRADGVHAPCCKLGEYEYEVSAHTHSLQEVSSSDLYARLRKQMTRGERPKACQRCWTDEQAGLKSYRQKALDQWGHLPTEKPAIQVAEFAFGNLCNAACIICDNGNSSRWYEDSVYLEEKAPGVFNRHIMGKFHHDFNNWTDEDLSLLRVIILGQSESLIQPQFKEFMRRMSRLNFLGNLEIEINTNGGYFPDEELLNFLRGAKRLDVQISIDGIEEEFEFLRYPLKWKIVDGVARRWVDVLNSTSTMKLRCRFTVSVLNVFEVDRVLQWWADVGQAALVPKNFCRVNFGHVTVPNYLAPSLLRECSIEADLNPLILPMIKMNFLEAEKALESKLKLFQFLDLMTARRGIDARKIFGRSLNYIKITPNP